MAQIKNFDEKAKLNDSLTGQKDLTNSYNSFANECSSPELKGLFMNILSEEHTIQHDLFCEMKKRGWVEVPAVEQSKVQETVNKFKSSI